MTFFQVNDTLSTERHSSNSMTLLECLKSDPLLISSILSRRNTWLRPKPSTGSSSADLEKRDLLPLLIEPRWHSASGNDEEYVDGLSNLFLTVQISSHVGDLPRFVDGFISIRAKMSDRTRARTI
jgi:hypothetical protein